MKYTIKRSDRKSIQLKFISLDECQVNCNYNVTRNQINDFIRKSQDWVNNNKKRLQEQDELFKQLFTNDKILLYGKEIKVYYNQQNDWYDNENNALYSMQNSCKSILINMAESCLTKRLNELSTIMKIRYSNLKISNAKTRWGSCSSSGLIMLNYRIICLPLALQDYIIIHELAHRKELNHSKNFWNIVSEYCCDYKNLRKSLKNYAFLFKVE